MWQDVDRHTRDHFLTDIETGDQVYVTSTHHQMMRPGEKGKVIAKAAESTYKRDASQTIAAPSRSAHLGDDVEVVWYEETNSLAFQPHPEYGSKPTVDYFKKLVERYDLLNLRKAI